MINHDVLVFTIKFHISLWDCIKLRIAGKGADKLCQLLFDKLSTTIGDGTSGKKPLEAQNGTDGD